MRNAASPGISIAFPQVPFVSSATNGKMPAAVENVPVMAQLPGAAGAQETAMGTAGPAVLMTLSAGTGLMVPQVPFFSSAVNGVCGSTTTKSLYRDRSCAFVMSPKVMRPPSGMNCHKPTAPTEERSSGSKPLSIIATYSSHAGNRSRSSALEIIP